MLSTKLSVSTDTHTCWWGLTSHKTNASHTHEYVMYSAEFHKVSVGVRKCTYIACMCQDALHVLNILTNIPNIKCNSHLVESLVSVLTWTWVGTRHEHSYLALFSGGYVHTYLVCITGVENQPSYARRGTELSLHASFSFLSSFIWSNENLHMSRSRRFRFKGDLNSKFLSVRSDRAYVDDKIVVCGTSVELSTMLSISNVQWHVFAHLMNIYILVFWTWLTHLPRMHHQR